MQKLSSDLHNSKIVLISDAGSPLISDPGFKLIQYCIKNNVNISVIPGPAQYQHQLSGIPINILFFGFCPETKR